MNRFTLYGDLLFETIRVAKGKPQYLIKHFNRLMFGARMLNFETEGFNFEAFSFKIQEALGKYGNGHGNEPENLRLRFVVYRDSQGFYLPLTCKVNFLVEIFPVQLSTQAAKLRAGIYTFQAKAPGPLSNLKSGNALIFVLAAIWAKENKFDDALIVNTDGHIIEAISSNIFWMRDGKWHTPPLGDGCVKGVMREVFMEAHDVVEKSCSARDLLGAEKTILTNALQGVRDFVLIA